MLLCLQKVSKRYQKPSGDRVALDGVSLELDRGQMLGIFGPSGSGKTTLLRISAGLQRPDSGVVIYNGEPLGEMSSRERARFRRREIACVWASNDSPGGIAVLEHVAMPLLVDGRDHRAAGRQAREALLVCEAEHCLGMNVNELSDGERQRVALARALVSEPRLLLADCPAAKLSLAEQEGIMGLLGALAREAKAAILITDSNAETLLGADAILYLCDGKLINPEAATTQARVFEFPAHLRRAAGDA